MGTRVSQVNGVLGECILRRNEASNTGEFAHSCLSLRPSLFPSSPFHRLHNNAMQAGLWKNMSCTKHYSRTYAHTPTHREHICVQVMMPLLTLLDQPFVCHENVLGIDNDDFTITRADRKVIEADIEQVEGELKVIVGKLLGDVHQLACQVYSFLPGRVVEAPQLLAHVVDSHHAPTRSQVLGKWPPFIWRKALWRRNRWEQKKCWFKNKRRRSRGCAVKRWLKEKQKYPVGFEKQRG